MKIRLKGTLVSESIYMRHYDFEMELPGELTKLIGFLTEKVRLKQLSPFKEEVTRDDS